MAFSLSLEGKNILVTGASSGIGRATAISCAKAGANVVLTGRDVVRLQDTYSQLNLGNHFVLPVDLAITENIENLFGKIVECGIKLDGMVHCAGIPYVMPLKSLTRERLEHVMNVNFYSYVELCRQFVKAKHSNDGASIIGMTAVLTKHPRPFELGYIASKAAVEVATKVFALEVAKRGIRINCIAPGSVRTAMVEQVIEEQHNEENVNKAVNRAVFGWVMPEEVADTCVFLLSDCSRKITGKIIEVDGGYN